MFSQLNKCVVQRNFGRNKKGNKIQNHDEQINLLIDKSQL